MQRFTSIVALLALASAQGPLPKDWTALGAAAAGIDTTVSHGGRTSGFVKVTQPQPGGNGLVQTIRASGFLGKRLRLSAHLKPQDARSAVLFFRIDGPRRVLEFATSADEPLKSGDWQERALILDVPDSAISLSYGVTLAAGQVWIDDVQIERVGHEYSTSVSRPARAPVRAGQRVKDGAVNLTQPSNLDFENN